ncbi:protein BPS1, chloroplastic-like [Andrographis paniculata]|uniref:protein BPS1, chloroplastic-like n=1 Tax=Andrographis paniculata TaxID=175694 RepID=UPI0021E780EE|nr:protein BPS1, chloroplastic-like [Andrographis paniculata]XP_051128541.1 protein BPS1, chloroplastic-like [Andrographis paniculata]
MSRAKEPQKPFLPFGNPFRMISPKGSQLSPKLLRLLNQFEETLAGRIKMLKPAAKEDILSLSWMRCAVELLCGIHSDIKSLITDLEFPVCDWDDKWIDLYLDNSVKLLDLCISFSSEISRMKQGQLFLQCALHNLGADSSKQFVRARSSLDGWRQHITSKNPRLDNCFCVMDGLAQMLELPKIKNSAKGKVLMQAMYGVKVATLFICSVFAAAFSGSTEKLMDLKVSETYLWAKAFSDLQIFVNTEIRNTDSSRRMTVLKELEAVDTGVQKLYPIVQDGVDPVEAKILQNSASDLGRFSDKLSLGLDLLAKEVDRFFQIVLTGRDALLGNIRTRIGDSISDQVETRKKKLGPAIR